MARLSGNRQPGTPREGGARLRRAQELRRLPLISLITSTLNASKELGYTIASVRLALEVSREGLLGGEMEWIVMDGASSDATVAILGAHEDVIEYWLSEPDAGIYDAWNKACRHARGEWLLFLGAGDELGPASALAAIAAALGHAHPQYDVVYGKKMYLSSSRVPLEEVGEPWESLRGKWELMRPALPPHGAAFHHRSLFEGAAPFDARFRIAGDSHFLLRHVLRKPPLFIPALVSRVPIGGVSLRLATASAVAAEIHSINRELGLRPPWRHRLGEGLLLLAKRALWRMLPERLAFQIADLYRLVLRKPKRWSVK